MDKYEFNIKVEQIKKLIDKNDYKTAMTIADEIDWRRVRNANLLSMVSDIYEKNSEFQDAKDILVLAFERAPIGKRLLYKICELSLKLGNVQEAESYYKEFCEMAPDDTRQYLLRYMILKEKGALSDQLIHSLEAYTNVELDEKWMYQLAELYSNAGDTANCIKMCDKIMLMFGIGKYVDKAMELKKQYAPLNEYQKNLEESQEKKAEPVFVETKQPEVNATPVVEPEASVAEEPVFEEPAAEEPEAELDVITETPAQPELEAYVHQVETEAKLAAEMSKLAQNDDIEEADETELERTRILTDIRSLKNNAAPLEETKPEVNYQEPVQEPVQKPVQEPEPENLEEDELQFEEEDEIFKDTEISNNFMVEAVTPEKGLELAVNTLKKIRKETESKNPVVKISGEKLNKRGILAVEDKISGKDLIIENAGVLSEDVLSELAVYMNKQNDQVVVVLIDSPKELEKLHRMHPELARKFECIGAQHEEKSVEIKQQPAKRVERQRLEPAVKQNVKPAQKKTVQNKPVQSKPVQSKPVKQKPYEEEMDIDEFAQYACKYASEIDCSITGKSMLALYERIEIMEEDNIKLTKSNAEALIEEAADKAEKPSFGKRIKGVFSSKYNKEGKLILKEEHFI